MNNREGYWMKILAGLLLQIVTQEEQKLY